MTNKGRSRERESIEDICKDKNWGRGREGSDEVLSDKYNLFIYVLPHCLCEASGH